MNSTKRLEDDEKEKIELIKLLMSAKLFDNQEDIKETIEEGIKWAQDYFHVKKGYKDEQGTWIINPDYDLLIAWVVDKSGFYWDGSVWVETMTTKARQRFG